MEIPLGAEYWDFKRAPRHTDGAGIDDWRPDCECDILSLGSHAQPANNVKNIDDWLPVKQMPSNIHLELMHHGIIKDPSLGLNEPKVQCAGNAILQRRPRGPDGLTPHPPCLYFCSDQGWVKRTGYTDAVSRCPSRPWPC